MMTSFYKKKTMTSFFSSKKQKTSTENVASLEGTTTTETDNDDDDGPFQNQREGALKLPSTKAKPKKTILNTYLQDYAATQLPRIDTNGHLFTTFGKAPHLLQTGK
jgi:hypothetical protein